MAINLDLYHKAVAADEEFQRELVRVYGKRAGDMRYVYGDHKDAKVNEARNAKLAADQAWRVESSKVAA